MARGTRLRVSVLAALNLYVYSPESKKAAFRPCQSSGGSVYVGSGGQNRADILFSESFIFRLSVVF